MEGLGESVHHSLKARQSHTKLNGRNGKSVPHTILSVLIHVVVVLLVITRGDVVKPLLIVKIPADSLFDAFLELEGGFPTELLLKF